VYENFSGRGPKVAASTNLCRYRNKVMPTGVQMYDTALFEVSLYELRNNRLWQWK
jgi:hypothetical protein